MLFLIRILKLLIPRSIIAKANGREKLIENSNWDNIEGMISDPYR